MEEQKDLFRIPLINIWYVILTLIFILMRITNIIDWSPLWILAPLWMPWVITFGIFAIIYLLKGIIFAMDCCKSNKYKI